MEKGIHIEGGKVDKEAVEASVAGIIEILKATDVHRSEAITLKALDILGGSLDVSQNYMTISGCSITNADTAVVVDTPNEDETE